MNADSLELKLRELGLSANETKVYTFLVGKAFSTINDVKGSCDLSESILKKTLNSLYKKELVTKAFLDDVLVVKAMPVKSLNKLLLQKKDQLRVKRRLLTDLITKLEAQFDEKEESVKTKVKKYSGVEGLKQVMWNSIEANGVIRLFEVATMSEYLDYGFYEQVRLEYLNKGTKLLELTNLDVMPGWTNVESFVEKCWEAKYIDPKLLEMKFELLLYNDVVTIYQHDGYDIFCVEVYNFDLAVMQKQLFDFVWKKATPMKVLDKHGAAVLEK